MYYAVNRLCGYPFVKVERDRKCIPYLIVRAEKLPLQLFNLLFVFSSNFLVLSLSVTKKP